MNISNFFATTSTQADTNANAASADLDNKNNDKRRAAIGQLQRSLLANKLKASESASQALYSALVEFHKDNAQKIASAIETSNRRTLEYALQIVEVSIGERSLSKCAAHVRKCMEALHTKDGKVKATSMSSQQLIKAIGDTSSARANSFLKSASFLGMLKTNVPYGQQIRKDDTFALNADAEIYKAISKR